jgi:Glycosyl transferases group 1
MKNSTPAPSLRRHVHAALDARAQPLVVTGELRPPAEPLSSRARACGPRRPRRPLCPTRRICAVPSRAHVLLHPQMNDSCPSVVLEAMACGLPAVYPASGGTVELVANVGGIGVPHHASWGRLDPPAPEALAETVSCVLADHDRYRQAARRRVAKHFSLPLARPPLGILRGAARPSARTGRLSPSPLLPTNDDVGRKQVIVHDVRQQSQHRPDQARGIY